MKKTRERSLKNLFDFYINSSIHVALAIVSFAVVTLINFQHPIDYSLLIFIFLGTITGYNFIKYAGIAKLHHLSLAKNLRMIQIFSLLVFIGLIISAFYQPLEILSLAGVTGIITVLYALPIFSNNRNLRRIPGLKIFVIALVVAAVTVLMPLVIYESLWQWDVFVEFTQRFAIAIVLILPFELRDLRFDMAQLGTLPQKFGVKGTKIIGYLLIAFFVLIEFLKLETHLENVVALIILALVIFWSLRISKIRQSLYFSSFYVEAIPVFWLLELLLLKFII